MYIQDSAARRLTSWDDDDNEENDDADYYADTHLHVFPPHLFSDSVGAPSKALSGHGQVVGFVLQGVETLSSLGDFVDVLAHYTHGVIDLLQ